MNTVPAVANPNAVWMPRPRRAGVTWNTGGSTKMTRTTPRYPRAPRTILTAPTTASQV